MRVAVVTPYYKEPAEWLGRCIRSVREQTREATHFVVADGHPQDWVDDAGVRHLKLDRAHGDYGNTPRALGAMLAVSEGYDAIAFLDGDNWYAPEHVQRCVEAAERHPEADYVTAMRHWARADGSVMTLRMEEDLDGSHVDTNCYFLLRGAFHTIPRWGLMPRPMAMWCDRFYLGSLRGEGLVEVPTDSKTVYYLCTWAHVYRSIGEQPPEFAKEGLPVHQLASWYRDLGQRDREIVFRLTGYMLPAHA
jgi:glycosyltransferase involved in cell wall biosynthesis